MRAAMARLLTVRGLPRLASWIWVMASSEYRSPSRPASLAGTARGREADPKRPAPTAENRRDLALGPGHRRRLDQDQRPAPGTLTSSKPSQRSRKDRQPGPVEPRTTRLASRAAVIPGT